MRKAIIPAAVLAVLLAAGVGAQQKFGDIMSVKKVLKNVQDQFSKTKSYKAKFKIQVEREKRQETLLGTVKYRSPGRIIFLFDQPEGQLVYTDGQVLRIYLPELRVVGEQKLVQQSQDIMFINSRTSFYQLTRQYNISFPKEAVKTVGKEKFYILHLTQKNVYSGFRTLDLWVSPEWMIIKAVGKARDNKTITMTFRDIEVNGILTDAEFEFNLPVDVQTIYDPLYTQDKK
jgi:outer membrane lipoprotein-sorting protein